MKASLAWIRALLPELKIDPDTIAQRLTAGGVEVEDVLRQAAALEGVVTAEVRAVEPHPNADKLRLTTIWDGRDTHRVVCGAPNVAAGQKVGLARLGARLPNGIEIAPRKIRGVESAGMLVSLEELGLAEASEGILVLPPRTKPGKPIAGVLGRDDVIFELGVTPNRGDVLSHLGVARELAALFGLPAPKPKAKPAEKGKPASELVKVTIRRGAPCSRYAGRVIEGVKVGPSPEWVVRRLEAIGLRSISNVVDATNLALHELGHPLHAFDLDRIAGAKIVVRKAEPDEKLETLDGATRSLDAEDLVIADARQPVALAGVMGGAGSEVSGGTTRVLLECALFDPRSVRKTARRHALHTDASHRFEREVDPDGLERAIDRCAELVLELAGGQLRPGRVEAKQGEVAARVVPIRAARASLVLGRPVDKKEIRESLGALGLRKVAAPKSRPGKAARAGARRVPNPSDALHFRVPSWRSDLHREEDLIEEVARLAGYASIPTLMPPMPSAVWTAAPRAEPSALLRAAMVAEGCFEAVSLAFVSPQHIAALGGDPGRAVWLANPLGEETAAMRTSLLPALLKAVRLNQSHQRLDVRLFELGHAFEWASPPERLPVEEERLAIALRGRREPEGWSQGGAVLDAYDLKGLVESALEALGVRGARFVADDAAWLHPRSATRIEVDGRVLGRLGELHPTAMDAFELEGLPVFVAELSVEAMAAASGGRAVYAPIPRFPPMARDLSFFVPRTVSAERILDEARAGGAGGPLVRVDVFDVYEGKGIPEGQRSVAIRMVLRDAERTLTDQEADAAMDAVAARLESALGASLRRAQEGAARAER